MELYALNNNMRLSTHATANFMRREMATALRKGPYQTNENSIYFGETKIDRKSLQYHKYSSFRGKCNVFDDFELFSKALDKRDLIKGNKI